MHAAAPIDVRLPDLMPDRDTPLEPLMRVLLRVEVKTKKDTGTTSPGNWKWVYWYWQPVSSAKFDCGYSGIREDHKSFKAVCAFFRKGELLKRD